MKKLSVLSLLVFLFTVTAMTAPMVKAASRGASATSGRLGLGAMLGDPTTLTFKYWLSSSTAFDGHIGSSFGDSGVVMGDYLWHFTGSVGSLTNGKVSSNFLPYIGLGGVLFFNADNDNRHGIFYDSNGRSFGRNSAAFGARVPFGIEYLADSIPFGFFLELTPGITIVPRIVGFFQAGIGARFYF
ncbi:MAG: hypothetical protein H7222_18460 [Methylotenera sp.]|nr:hypothetical protein [Oligoflexia bacterium]